MNILGLSGGLDWAAPNIARQQAVRSRQAGAGQGLASAASALAEARRRLARQQGSVFDVIPEEVQPRQLNDTQRYLPAAVAAIGSILGARPEFTFGGAQQVYGGFNKQMEEDYARRLEQSQRDAAMKVAKIKGTLPSMEAEVEGAKLGYDMAQNEIDAANDAAEKAAAQQAVMDRMVIDRNWDVEDKQRQADLMAPAREAEMLQNALKIMDSFSTPGDAAAALPSMVAQGIVRQDQVPVLLDRANTRFAGQQLEAMAKPIIDYIKMYGKLPDSIQGQWGDIVAQADDLASRAKTTNPLAFIDPSMLTTGGDAVGLSRYRFLYGQEQDALKFAAEAIPMPTPEQMQRAGESVRKAQSALAGADQRFMGLSANKAEVDRQLAEAEERLRILRDPKVTRQTLQSMTEIKAVQGSIAKLGPKSLSLADEISKAEAKRAEYQTAYRLAKEAHEQLQATRKSGEAAMAGLQPGVSPGNAPMQIGGLPAFGGVPPSGAPTLTGPIGPPRPSGTPGKQASPGKTKQQSKSAQPRQYTIKRLPATLPESTVRQTIQNLMQQGITWNEIVSRFKREGIVLE